MSMTIGGNTVVNPFHDGGWSRRHVRVGADWTFLDGSQGEHQLSRQYEWTIVWRVMATNYSNLVTALTAVAGTAFAVVDHLGNGETCKLAGDWTDGLLGNTVHEVSATFRETTA